MSLSNEEKLRITNESLRNIIKDLLDILYEIVDELKGQTSIEEIKKEIEQILKEEVTWHEFQN